MSQSVLGEQFNKYAFSTGAALALLGIGSMAYAMKLNRQTAFKEKEMIFSQIGNDYDV